MKKRLIIAVMILVVALVGVLASCTAKFGISDLFDIASYKTNSPERNTIVQVKDGDQIVFHSKNGELVKKDCIKEINFKNIIKKEDGEALNFDQAYFENEVFQAGKIKALYTADIKDVESFLGVPEAEEAKIEIMVGIETKSLISMRIYYKVPKKLATYDVQVTVLAA